MLVGSVQLAIFAAIGRPPDPLIFLTIQGLIGSGSAAGTLALARRSDDLELLESGREVSEIGLTKEEKRLMLGERLG